MSVSNTSNKESLALEDRLSRAYAPWVDEPKRAGPMVLTIAKGQSVFKFPATLAAPAMARTATANVLRGQNEPTTATSVLLVSELVTNSVRHAGMGPQEQVEMRITTYADRVKFEIIDSGSGFDYRPRDAAADRVGGWGLYLLAQLSSSWGMEARPTNTWFELPVPGVSQTSPTDNGPLEAQA